MLVTLFHGKCKCPRDLETYWGKKWWGCFGYFSQVLWNTNGTTAAPGKMQSLHAAIPGKIVLRNTGTYKDPSGSLKSTVVWILLKGIY